MTVAVHYRKEPTEEVINFTNKTYYRTEAVCGLYSEVPNLGQGMRHTDVIEDVTCENCLDALGMGTLAADEPTPVEFAEEEPEEAEDSEA